MENIEEFEFDGLLIGEGNYNPGDYELAGLDGDINERLKKVKEDKFCIEYDQSKLDRTKMACTLFMGMGMISDMTGYIFEDKEKLEICDSAEKDYGWSPADGGYLYKAVDCVRNYWNTKYPEKELVSFAVKLGSDEYIKLIDAGKTIGVGYHTTKEYRNDSQDNGSIDTESFAGCKKLGGHAVRINRNNIIDNYITKKKFNKYLNKHILKQKSEGTFYDKGYVFFMKEDEIFSDLDTSHPFYKRIIDLHDKGIIKGYSDGTIRLDENITRGEMFVLLSRTIEYISNISK